MLIELLEGQVTVNSSGVCNAEGVNSNFSTCIGANHMLGNVVRISGFGFDRCSNGALPDFLSLLRLLPCLDLMTIKKKLKDLSENQKYAIGQVIDTSVPYHTGSEKRGLGGKSPGGASGAMGGGLSNKLTSSKGCCQHGFCFTGWFLFMSEMNLFLPDFIGS